jgi:triphosphoribosyl-dephospho-CoA synthetase
MISDRDVWQAAVLMVKRYGEGAMLEASERADQLLAEGGRLYVLEFATVASVIIEVS